MLWPTWNRDTCLKTVGQFFRFYQPIWTRCFNWFETEAPGWKWWRGFSDFANQFKLGAPTDLKQRHPVENSWCLLKFFANQFEPSAPTVSGRRHLVENSRGLINLKSEHGAGLKRQNGCLYLSSPYRNSKGVTNRPYTIGVDINWPKYFFGFLSIFYFIFLIVKTSCSFVCCGFLFLCTRHCKTKILGQC